jgi:hypothetical protein
MGRIRRILTIAVCADEAQFLMEKSLFLARRCEARLEIVVTDAAQMRAVMKHCDFHTNDQVLVSCVHRGAESLAEFTLSRLQASSPDLIVKSPDLSDPTLAAECPVPVLLVRGRPWDKHARVAVVVEARDFLLLWSSRDALRAATRLSLACGGDLDVLYSEPDPDDEGVAMERAVEVAKLMRELHAGFGRFQMFSGAPEKRLPPLIAARRYDVLVLAAGAGSADRLAGATGGDVMLVRSNSHVESRMAARRRSSRRQQSPHEAQQVFGVDRLADDSQIRVGLELANHG